MNSLLICTLGASWAVIPEIYGFLSTVPFDLYAEHPQRSELNRLRAAYEFSPPDELWVLTTESGQTRKSLDSLQEWRRQLSHPPILRVWSASGVDQLASSRECRHFRELAFRAVLLGSELTHATGGQLLLSLAGGRKTMSADLQAAASVLGAQAILHVVASDKLPKELWEVTPESMSTPLPRHLLVDPLAHLSTITPLVTGSAQRSELIDLPEAITAARFPLPDASLNPCSWPCPEVWLIDEIARRERESSHLLGNFLFGIAEHELHENFRSLYRLPPGVIQHLRQTSLDECHLTSERNATP